jgi:hypothetical protein
MKKLIVLAVFAWAPSAHAATISTTSSQGVRITQQTIPTAVIPPRINSHPAADYTLRAYRDKVEGSVVIQAQFDTDGSFQVLKVVKGLGYGYGV